ncbi:mhkB [Symbiodinium pilosum]|uniref:MhkB protein n=1 Tax=Symbiodinium pilosum TaxID=2952 RepID=A0A812QIE0_SYMPI|nr:mhkB [Symbiodinium pilosum]
METMMDPMEIRFSQENLGEHFRDGTSIFETYDQILQGMEKREVHMIHVVQRGGHYITLDNRRVAVYKMVRKAGKCGKVKVKIMHRDQVDHELRRKSDSTVEGLSVKVRGTDKVIHHRADIGGHWSDEQLRVIGTAISDFEKVTKEVLGPGARLVKAGSFMKGTDIAGESDVDVMVFGCGPISDSNWQRLVEGIRSGGYTIYTITSTNPRCIHVQASGGVGCIAIEFDVVAKQRQGFPPNKEPTNPFKENRLAASAARGIRKFLIPRPEVQHAKAAEDFQDSEEGRFSGNSIEEAVLSEYAKLNSPGLGKLIDAAKATLKKAMLDRRKRVPTTARENDASENDTNWSTVVGEGTFRKVYRGRYTVGERVGQASAAKVFKDGTEAYEDAFFAEDVKWSEKAIEIVDEFNKVKKFNRFVQVCKPDVWVKTRTKQRLLMEPFLHNFQKFNSNTAWAGETEWAKALQSLSQFSYHFTGGDMVLCDLQGAVEDDVVVFTDPAINSKGKRFGPADLGEKGIENFFHHHVCSKWCDASWRKPGVTSTHFAPQMGTSMILR